MVEYLHLFENETDYNDARLNDYSEPWVSATNLVEVDATPSYRVNYNKTEEEKLPETPLTFEIVSGGTLYWYNNGNTGDAKTIEYKLNDGEWTSITSSKDNDGSGTTIATVVTGDIIRFRGNNNTYCNQYSSRYNCFKNTSDCYFYAYGNIMSLISYDNFKANKKLTGDSAFAWLFYNTGIMSHPEKKLLLPATTLASYCYASMFAGCYNLTTAPELPATTLRSYCYKTMFDGCVSLVTAPKLPATTLEMHCYEGMFNWCNSLVDAPELPATTLAQNCYYWMFNHCISLVNAPELPATTLTNGCYHRMFDGCEKLTTAPELPATTLATDCYQYMFDCCTSLTTAPALPATTLAQQCYKLMFSGCKSLNYIKCLATDISANGCINGWVNAVASTGTFVKNQSMTSWPTGASGIPNGWTVQDV